jgi:hypothetical protein
MGALSRGINRALAQLTQLNPQENGERAKSKEADNNGPLSRRRLRDKGKVVDETLACWQGQTN